MLQPTTAILKFEPLAFNSARRRINSSSGRFRKKNVPVYCLRSERRRASFCRNIPYEEMGLEFRNAGGSRFHTHLLSRKYIPMGDLRRIGKPNIVIKELPFAPCCVAINKVLLTNGRPQSVGIVLHLLE